MKKYIIIFSIIISLIIAGGFVGNDQIEINKFQVVNQDIPKSFDKYRILQITDLHAKDTEKIELNIWKEIESLEFDMVVITGDIVDSTPDAIVPHLGEIEKLSSQGLVVFVNGNHDTYNYSYYRKLVRYLKEVGVVILENESLEVKKNNEIINIIGSSDYTNTDYTPVFNEINRLDPQGFNLLLSHQPYIFDEINRNQVDLLMTGHTHGGQLRLPFLPVLYAPGRRPFPEYGYGWYEKNESKMFISKGLGATGILPFRFYNRPELVIYELNKK